MLAVALVAAVIAGDHVVLRASPSRTAAQQAVLWRGDWLEVRGEQRGWLKVYDHRHERPGWVARPAARVVTLDEAGRGLLKEAMENLGLSARAHDRILRVARTIADLEGSADVRHGHVTEAISYRSLDRKLWAR